MVAVAVASFSLVSCGEQSASPPSDRTPRSLPAPISAESPDRSTPIHLDVDGDSAPIDPVATDAEGTLLPPSDVGRLGWWVDSSLPGSGAGTVVVAGHVDDGQRTGWASRFAQLAKGDGVTVVTVAGQRLDYRVTSVVDARREGSGPSSVPYDELNRQTGPETLALVTCGGPFVGPPLGYRDNVVVFASPV